MKYTVVIVTYNRFNLLKECLFCVENQLVKFNDVVIVDNKSTDGTTDYLKTLVDKYHIIFESENGGGAKGFKDGVEYVRNNIKTDWILLIDDDAMLLPDYLKIISNAIEKYPDCYAFSGTIFTEGNIDITHRRILKLGLQFKMIPVSKECYLKEYFEYDLSSFCGLVFSPHLIERIGLPRADYFIWYDDSEYSLRIRKETKIINVNAASINHKTSFNSQTLTLNWRGYYGIRNSGDVIKRYGTKIQFYQFLTRIRIAQFKNGLISLFSKDKSCEYNYNLYRDAIRDLKNAKFGFNVKYHA